MGIDLIESLGDGKAHGQALHIAIFTYTRLASMPWHTRKTKFPKNHTFTLEKTLNTLSFDMYPICKVFFYDTISCDII